MSENTIIEMIKDNPGDYSGIVFVRTYGYHYDTSLFFRQIKSLDNTIKIIDDKCLCIPDFNSIGSSVDMELYSTGDAKTISLGYGGFAKVNSEIELTYVNEPYNPLSYQLLEGKYKECLKERIPLDDYKNDWLDTRIPTFTKEKYFVDINNSIQSTMAHKDILNEIYQENLRGVVSLGDGFHNWRYNIISSKKDSLMHIIFQSGLFASSHYIPANTLFDKCTYPVADKLSNTVLNLFNDFNFTETQALKICELICEHS